MITVELPEELQEIDRLVQSYDREWVVQRFPDRRASGQFDVVDRWSGTPIVWQVEAEVVAQLIANAPTWFRVVLAAYRGQATEVHRLQQENAHLAKSHSDLEAAAGDTRVTLEAEVDRLREIVNTIGANNRTKTTHARRAYRRMRTAEEEVSRLTRELADARSELDADANWCGTCPRFVVERTPS